MNYFIILIKLWYLRPVSWILLGAFQVLSALSLNGFYFSYLNNQDTLSNTSATSYIIPSYSGILILLTLLFTPMITMSLIAGDQEQKRQPLISSLPYSIAQLFLSKFMLAMCVSLIPLFLSLLMSCSLTFSTSLDFGLIISNYLGIFLITLLCCSIGLWASSLTTSSSVAVAITYTFLLLFWVIESLIDTDIPILSPAAEYVAMVSHFRSFREGILSWSSITFYIYSSAIFLSLGLHQYAKTCFNHNQYRYLPQTIVLSIGVFFIASFQFNHTLDISDAKKNTLDRAITSHIVSINTPVNITAYTLDSEKKEALGHAFGPFLRASEWIALQYQPPTIEPSDIEKFDHSIIIKFSSNGKETYLQYPFNQPAQQAIGRAILTLAAEPRWIVFLEGHNERSLFGKSNRDLNILREQLENSHYHVQSFDTGATHILPDNVDLLVLADPKEPLSSGAITLIKDYIAKGKPFIWLQDPDRGFYLDPLESLLGISRIPGTLIDYDGFKRGTPHPSIILVDDYPEHPITDKMKQLTAFPWAGALSIKKDTDWTVTPFILSKKNTWVETETTDNAIYNPELGDLKGSFPIGVALTRNINNNTQKVIVTSTSHFISDAAINNYGNKQLALSLFHWLQPITAPLIHFSEPAPKDRYITPLKSIRILVVYIYPWVIPIGLMSTGFFIWLSRRKYL